MQMVRAFCCFARTGDLAGTMPSARLLALDAGEEIADEGVRVLPKKIADLTRTTMRGVTQKIDERIARKEHDASAAPRYEWFGKSGTAEIPLGRAPKGKVRPIGSDGYFPNQYNSSFLAAAPLGAKEVEPLAIGAAAPELNLPGVDGKTYKLADFDDADILVVIFTCNHCPTAQAYEQRIVRLEADYRDKGVALVAISPNDPRAMTQYAEECRALGIDFMFDPGQQCARMSGPELADGITGASIVICNDYEFELVKEKTGLDVDGLLDVAAMVVVTRGEAGSSVIARDGEVQVPAVPPTRIVDPTGVGDAFRAGFLKGLAQGASPAVCAQIGSVAATYALEHLGGQSHAYTIAEFEARYRTHFGTLHLSRAD